VEADSSALWFSIVSMRLEKVLGNMGSATIAATAIMAI
jgi:hypothetical protein